MLTDKEQKRIFKKTASQNPDKFYPVKVLNEKGFVRKHCSCGMYFWTTNPKREKCGDPACSGGFQVVYNNPSKNKLSFIGVWKKIVEILEPRGYKPIKRYPVVARWNPTVEFTIASIAAFQPYVITGEQAPPAKMLIIPQFCLRFGDVENVGITGSHCTGFVMIGQHVFVPPEEWDQCKYFRDIYDFLVDGVGLSKDEITIHEDAWAGGGSYGPCMEFFSRGVELFNQVYTMFEQTPDGDRELKLKVLDMGLGQERVAWFSQGTPNIYEAVFPYVLKKLKERTNVEQDFELYKKFSQYSAYLNIDEVEDIEKAWENVAEKLQIDADTLKQKILPMTGLYSVAEHARALLFAISDGKLPSNVGGGYNLRVIFRRAVSFASQFGWDIKLNEVCKWHAEELHELFPEVGEHLDEVSKILDVEYEKYFATKEKAIKIVQKMLEKGTIDEDTLLQLYDSNGIDPDMVVTEARKLGLKMRKPDDFYNKVVQLHEQKEQIHQTYKEIDLALPDGIPDTIVDYFSDYLKLEQKAKVLLIKKAKIDDQDCWAVITDKTIAYPTSGGQLHDNGQINDVKFNDVVKFHGYIVHCLEKKPNFNLNDVVTIKIDKEWRTQLAAHHTATHVINAAAREILGEHINQASAKKTYDKAHLDITHFDSLSDEEVKKIEIRANEIVKKNISLNARLVPRTEAELKYGMRLYQGGAVPGKEIRVVEIPGEDVEACGGTHMHSTGEIGKIKIIKTQKIQDGIVRITFTAGKAVDRLEEINRDVLKTISTKLEVLPEQIPARITELMEKKKLLQKQLSTGQIEDKNAITLSKKQKSKQSAFEIIDNLSDELKCTIETLELVIDKNLSEYKRLVDIVKGGSSNKTEDTNTFTIGDSIEVSIKFFDNLLPKEIVSISQNFLKENPSILLITLNTSAQGISLSGFLGTKLIELNKLNLGNILREFSARFGGKGGGNAGSFQGMIPLQKDSITKNTVAKMSSELPNFLKSKIQ
jgi:alanyl-tRNA synthetase